MSPILNDRFAAIERLSLTAGNHESFERGMCIMEAASYIAGEPWSDHPQCACPVLTAFLMAWNDGLPTDADRDRLLKPLIERVIDTRSTAAVEGRRSYLALDWLIRVHTPKWLDLVPALASHAKTLRDLEEITDIAGAAAAGKFTAAAWDAAKAATGAAAWAAAWNAAKAAAWAAAWDAAWDAAKAAARAAAWAAAGAALKPTVEWLQFSALDLVDRMIKVQPNAMADIQRLADEEKAAQ